mmetsp:Transcript_8124/g.15296  ORF Transcript_8124/g.15296 Transcript_8124/m.15296 type:complete len:651 (-) Transcript_8124:46-1998(-)
MYKSFIDQQQCRGFSFFLLGVVFTYRVINALILETQFDPDEYWQTLEPAYCIALSTGHNCELTWEWTRRREPGLSKNITGFNWLDDALYGPVRSYVPLMPTITLYKFLKVIHLDTTWMIARAPLLLNAIVVVAPTDLAVFYISRYIFKEGVVHTNKIIIPRAEHWALLASMTNWFNGYALIRTYSNSVETVILALGILLLCPELFGEVCPKKDFETRIGFRIAFLLGGIGVVIRFTALAAWIPIGMIVCFRRHSFTAKVYHFCNVCFYGATGVVIGCVVDRCFYGFWAMPFLGSFHFNVLQGNGALYGTHPWFWYIVAGLPAISGILTVPLICQVFLLLRRSDPRNTIDSKMKVLLAVIESYVSLHSVSAHKEFRFILPILPLVCVLSGNALHKFCASCPFSPKTCFLLVVTVLFVTNYPHLFVLCTVHQRAPIQVNKVLSNHIKNMVEFQDIDSKRFSIHYLMGCHSTPLYSHLHVTKKLGNSFITVPIDIWYLDCSPECRSDPLILCESEEFSNNPRRFIEKYYTIPQINYSVCTDENECLNQDMDNPQKERKNVPDFLVIFEQDVNNPNSEHIKDILYSMGLEESEKMKHVVKGISFVRLSSQNERHPGNDLIVRLGRLGLKLHFEHMVVFTNNLSIVRKSTLENMS